MKISAIPRKYIFFALLVGIFVWLLCIFFQPFKPHYPEPQYQGKKLTGWAKEVYPDDIFPPSSLTPSLRTQSDRAVVAIQHIGTNALPMALALCQANDSRFKKKWEWWTAYNSEDVIKYRIMPAGEKRHEGVNIIWALGPMAEPTISSLVQLLQSSDREVADDIMPVFAGIGTNAIPPLVELLNSTNKIIRIRAATALGYFGRQTNAAVSAPMILPILVHRIETETNSIYFWALGNFSTNAASAVPVLLNILESKPAWQPPKPAALGALNRINPQIAQPLIEQWRQFNKNLH